eukprot:CAMPEP_0115603276 /NCGR_PEP_ID=MMETSP0272-20121206/16343_1 /TAXON_ID=71861 /ORGANISM="Scrippsiella trochoidea, Strain CCMP3099" /LENGTH=116 /DNA_ID=CAMNT_0003038791 /DNA_START=245 /DNA_END=592 /DNA_ORIENTATION=+
MLESDDRSARWLQQVPGQVAQDESLCMVIKTVAGQETEVMVRPDDTVDTLLGRHFSKRFPTEELVLVSIGKDGHKAELCGTQVLSDYAEDKVLVIRGLPPIPKHAPRCKARRKQSK